MRHSLSLASAVVLALSSAALAQDARPPLQQQVEQLYRTQQRAQAERLLARAPRAATWQAHRGVEVRAVFHSRAKGLTIEAVRKTKSKGELLVAVPPGTWAKPCTDKRYEDWPCPQDLLLIQARVLRLAPGQQRASVTLPVACAAFRRQGPRPTRAYTLQLAQPGSKLDRLAHLDCFPELRELKAYQNQLESLMGVEGCVNHVVPHRGAAACSRVPPAVASWRRCTWAATRSRRSTRTRPPSPPCTRCPRRTTR